MDYKLSIIIPCYNCSDTLEQAFNSCFDQGIEGPYEIVMVNDASTDNTKEVMEKLAQGKENVKTYSHEKNKGGGATRNTAVIKSTSDIIYCLDSDNILPKGVVGKMYKMITEKKCDGISIERSIKFKGNDTTDISFINDFYYSGERIPLESILGNENEKHCGLYSTFMFTKSAFEITGGYAEGHGFDTQSFAWRFLANDLIAYTCPDTSDLHRVQFNTSYYLREYESGKINHNWFKIFEEFLYLFNATTQQEILNFDLNNSLESLSDFLDRKTQIFRLDVHKFVKNNSREEYAKYLSTMTNLSIPDQYWLGVYTFNKKEFTESFDLFETLIKAGLRNGYAHNYLKKSAEAIGKKSNLVDEKYIETVFSYKKQGSKANPIVRVLRKIKKIIRTHVK
jgi:glycosyltransferase involved in cell wall biosynthesis